LSVVERKQDALHVLRRLEEKAALDRLGGSCSQVDLVERCGRHRTVDGRVEGELELRAVWARQCMLLDAESKREWTYGE